jgi:hypothetical protein
VRLERAWLADVAGLMSGEAAAAADDGRFGPASVEFFHFSLAQQLAEMQFVQARLFAAIVYGHRTLLNEC